MKIMVSMDDFLKSNVLDVNQPLRGSYENFNVRLHI